MDKESHRRGSAPVLSLLVVFAIVAGLIAAIVIVRRPSYTPSKASAAPMPSSINLLVNGNFDQGLSGWDRIRSVDIDRGRTAADQRVKGNVTLKVTSRVIGSGISQRLILPGAAATYTIKGYYKPVKDIAVLSVNLDVMGKNPQPYIIPLTITDDPGHPGWRVFTGPISLKFQNYASLYNDAAGGFVTNLKMTFPAVNQVVLLDDFKVAVDDGANIVQNESFEAGWNSGNDQVAGWHVNRGKVALGTTGAPDGQNFVTLSAAGSAKAASLTQEVTRLLVKGGDYDLSASVKGNAGWVGITEKLSPSGVFGPGVMVPQAWAAEDADLAAVGGPTDKFRCSDLQDSSGATYRYCRVNFTGKSSWTTMGNQGFGGKVIHIDENAVNVWVTLGVNNPGAAATSASFDNVKLVYHAAQASKAPVLVSPGDGSISNDASPMLIWQKPSGFGNSVVTQYVAEVSKSSDTKSDGSFQNAVTQVTIGADSNPERRLVGLGSDGKYFWHVLAINDSGQRSPWSGIWSFTVDTKRPSRITKLTATPKLGDSLGTANLQVTWPDAADPNFDHYEASVVHDNSTPVAGGSKQTLSSPQTTFNLSGLTNDDYVVIVYAVDKAGNKSRTAARFRYFEDRFNSDSLNSAWTREVKPGSSISVANNQVKIVDGKTTGANKFTRISQDLDLSQGYSAGLTISAASRTDLTKGTSTQGLFIQNNHGTGPTIFGVGNIFNNTGAYVGASLFSTNGWNYIANNTINTPFTVRIDSYDGRNFQAFYNGNLLTTAALVSNANPTTISLGILSSGPDFPVSTASFDNFRLIMIK